MPVKAKLQRLRLDHGPALLAFERENRAYFAVSIPDRGDDYFADFDTRHRELLAEQDAGLHHFHVLADDVGVVWGRVNLVDAADGAAQLGFRMAEHAAGRGLATDAVRQVCELAATAYDLSLLRAATTRDNLGSQTVLTRNGFAPDGETTLDDRPAITYRRHVGAVA